MARKYELVVESDIELAGSARDQLGVDKAFGFKLRLRTEGTFLVSSGPAVSNFHFHPAILPETVRDRNREIHSAGRASRNSVLKTIICGLVVPR